jgi:hypothetical protein
MARCVDGTQSEITNGKYDIIVNDVVVRGQHRGVSGAHPHVDTGFPHGGNSANVVPMTVRFKNARYAEVTSNLNESLVLVGRVNERRLSTPTTSHDVDIVVEWPDDKSMDVGCGVGPNEFDVLHAPVLAPGLSTRYTLATVLNNEE